MEKDARYFAVGLFVTISFMALVGFLIWLISPKDADDYSYYTVYFTASVGGLEEGSDVRYRGIPVGKVEELRFSDEHTELIKVDIAIDKETPVRKNTKVFMAMQGVTGRIHLELETLSGDKNPPGTPEGEMYPVLKGEGSRIDKIVSNFEKFSDEGFSEATAGFQSFRKLMDQLRSDPSQLLRKPDKKKAKVPAY